MKRLPNLDLLRLFLALEVLVQHWIAATDRSWMQYLGVPAVCAFVCLSGFLIPKSLEDSRSYWHFAWKRVLRIGPAFLASFVLVWALFGHEWLKGTLLCYLTMGTIKGVAYANWPLWSLALEEVLYAFHALTRSVLPWRPIVPITLGLASLWFLLRYPADSLWISPVVFFFIGNVAGFYRERVLSVAWWKPVSAVVLCRILFMAAGWNWLWMIPFTCALALAAATLPQVKFKFPDLSYGVYVYHFPWLLALDKHYGVSGPALLGWAMSAALGTACISWYLLEKPALSLKGLQLAGFLRRLDSGEPVPAPVPVRETL